MSDQPPNPQDPQQPGWGSNQPPQQPGWGNQPPPPPPGWNQPPGGGGGWQPPGPGGWGAPGAPDPNGYEAPQALGYGWRAFQAFLGPLLGATALALVVPVAIQLIGGIVGAGEIFSASVSDGGFDFDFNPMAVVFNILASAASLVLTAGLIRMAFDVVDGGRPDFSTMFSRFDVVQVIVAAILLGIATSIGLLLCIIPGVVVMFLTWFTNYFIVAKGEDAISAIRSSISFVSSNAGSMLLLALLSILAMIAGGLACGVGVLVAYPVVTVAAAYTFRYLQGEPIRPMAN